MDDIWISGNLDRRGVEKYAVPASAMMRTVRQQTGTMSLHRVPRGRTYHNNEVVEYFRDTWNVFSSRWTMWLSIFPKLIHVVRPNPETKRRDLGLKDVAHRNARRRICCVDQLENMLGNEFRSWRILHVPIHGAPCFCDPHSIARIVFRGCRNHVVELRGNIRRLKIDNANVGVRQFELNRHRESRHGCLRRVIG